MFRNGEAASAARAVLGACILDNTVIPGALRLNVEDIPTERERLIFAAMRELHEAGRPVDYFTLADELKRRSQLEKAGGFGFITSVTDGVIQTANIATYIQALVDNSRRRNIGKRAERVQRLVKDPSVSTAALAEFTSDIANGAECTSPRYSEEAIAERFSREYASELRYVAPWGRWMEYDGRRWVEDSTLRVFDRARAICRKASAELPDAEKSTATRLAAASTIAAVERIVKSDRRHAATVEQWDPNAWVLNTPAGTVDLTTGGIRAFKRDDYLTKITAASPAGDCPLWRQFLQRITDGSAELQNYLQRVVGYCLTGSTREHVILFGYGTGANGKSVAINTIMGMMGDYATSAPASTFTVSRSEEHPTGIAGLRGARFVSAIETEDGHFWAESKIKSLTGGDRVTARFMRQDFFTFTPEFKLLVAGNHKPGLRNVDEAMRRRLHLIPFTVTIPEQERDHQLTETLRAEWGGILRWAIDGCLLWQRQGLNPPAIVRDATSDYLQAEDALGRWLEEQTTAGEWSSGKALFADWQHWCEQTGERAGTQKRFTQSLIDHGIKAERTREARGFSGIVLKSDAVTHVSRSNIIGVTHAHA